jgi:hypothetical protein
MSLTSPNEQDLSAIKKEMDELERRIQQAIAHEDHTLCELREIRERLAKLDEHLYGLFCQQAHSERGKNNPSSESL